MSRVGEDEFLARCELIHGDRFNYSELKYTTMRSDVIISCPLRGRFTTKPYLHLKDKNGGCSDCLKECRKLLAWRSYHKTVNKRFKGKIELISDYKNVDGEAYIDIILTYRCEEHGMFKKSQRNLINSNHGCPECAMDAIRSPRPTRWCAPNNGAINWSKLSRDEGAAERDAVCYVVCMSNEHETFYKVGVSNYDSFYFRYRRHCKNHKVSLMEVYRAPMIDAYDLEQMIISTSEQYRPLVKFEGHTECFKSAALDLAKPKAAEFVRSTKKVGGKVTQHYVGRFSNAV